MSKRLIQNLAKIISKQVDHFSQTEVECLLREFFSIIGQTTGTGKSTLNERKFRSILTNEFGLTNNTIMERVFKTFDKDNDGFVSAKEWVEGLCVFLRGTLDERIKYCFHVYDLSGDDYISREEMLLMVRNCLRLHGEEDPYDGIKDLVEITLKRMDHDSDDKLSFDDYAKSVKELDIVLEAFGTCLPNATKIEMFEQRVFHDKKERR
ncbi:calaxin-like [Corythoichthys intestinalis]|uniref:calaxin-like n=1 Tax=Corythoichthys intestinalis TaxID=161448 RepID=UPI0025A55A1C|nr:calaxin-like [Corythoichthys intestinalis]XP_061809012.1 calaxin-like [Nerophis lumbriciformis]